MIAARSFSGKKVALFGLGGSGLATAEALAKGGAAISAWDDNPQKIAEAEAAGIQTVDLHGADFSDFDAMVLSPGVPLTHPKPHWTVELARAASIPIIGDIEIFSRELDKSKCPFIAITGTNGKSTTTALISHIIRQSGRDSQMGGNIGRAVLTLDPPEPGRYYIVECSSYQIDLAPSLSPDIGILLNVTPDHLDRHGTMENYMALKERLVARSTRAIVGLDDANTRKIAARLLDEGAKLVRISKRRKLDDGYFADGARLKCARSGEIMEIADISAVGSLRGAHNAQNALAAWAACEAVGLTHDEIRSGLATFPGLAHRMEQVGRIGNTVLFINDSKATNADAAAPALSSFANIRWIAGGLQKQGGFDALKPYFKNITKAYLIGEAAPALAAALGDSVPFEISVTLEAAVVHATADARNENSSESVVLLSPACASFDQFRNFEKRGEAFRSVVLELDGIEAIGGTIL